MLTYWGVAGPSQHTSKSTATRREALSAAAQLAAAAALLSAPARVGAVAVAPPAVFTTAKPVALDGAAKEAVASAFRKAADKAKVPCCLQGHVLSRDRHAG